MIWRSIALARVTKMVVMGFQLHRMFCVTLTIFVMSAAANDGCIRRCGDIDIPYPFGLTPECTLHSNFLINCHTNSFGHPIPLTSNNLTIRRISVDQPQMSIFFDVTQECYNAESGERIVTKNSATLRTPNSMFTISPKNILTVVGCESYLYLTFYVNNGRGALVLSSLCPTLDVVSSGYCSGIGCAGTQILNRPQNMTLEAHSFSNHNFTRGFNNCSYAFVVEENQFNFSRDYIINFPQQKLPLALDWAISYDTCVKGQRQPFCPCGENATAHDLEDGSGYYCLCEKGFQGNPYLPHGCQGTHTILPLMRIYIIFFL